jgi:hypothetical protein
MSTALKIGDRVFVTDQTHPWLGKAGEVISGEETYGLGWKGYRVKIDGTCGQETYVQANQVMGPGRVDRVTITMRRRKEGKP